MSTSKRVHCVVGDIGAAKEVFLLSRALSARGYTIFYFADPRGKGGPEVYANLPALLKLDPSVTEPIAYETREPFDSDASSLVIIGVSATAVSLQIAWTVWGKERSIPVLWIEDLYGTGERKATQGVSPDAMCVIDAVAAQIAHRVRPALRIEVTGKPSFKRLPSLIAQKPAIRAISRAALGVPDGEHLVAWLFSGDPPERSWDQLKAYAEVMRRLDERNNVREPIMIAFRFHPKNPDHEKQYEYAQSIKGIRFLDGRAVKDVQKFVLAADTVIGDWGNTDALTAVLAGIPTFTTLFPEHSGSVDDYQRRVDAGYPDGVPPLVMDAPRYMVLSPEEVYDAVLTRRVRGVDDEDTRRAAQFSAVMASDADVRMADVAEKMMK